MSYIENFKRELHRRLEDGLHQQDDPESLQQWREDFVKFILDENWKSYRNGQKVKQDVPA